MHALQKLRLKIKSRDYFLSAHAEEEMADDGFDRVDVEYAIQYGEIKRKLTHDSRGTRYCIEGLSRDGRRMTVVCRFKQSGSLIIITGYYVEGGKNEM
jgi:hypothetical protein